MIVHLSLSIRSFCLPSIVCRVVDPAFKEKFLFQRYAMIPMVYLVIGAIDKRACRLYEVSGMCLIFSSDGKFILSAGSPDPRLQLILIVKPFLIITYKISIF